MEINPYNIERFIERVKDKTKGEINFLAREEARKAEGDSAFRKGAPKARAQGSLKYAELLKALIAFVSSEQRPMNISDQDFVLFHPLCKCLVDQGVFKPEALKLFNKNNLQ